MKYVKALEKNMDTVDSRIMRDKGSSTLLFGNRPVSFYPVRGLRLTTVTDKAHQTGFHVIGLLHFGSGNDIVLCAELQKSGIDLFWVTNKGRISFNADDAAPFNYALNELVSFDDGNFDAMVKYVLATWSMDPTWL